jgi:hypothetical protein
MPKTDVPVAVDTPDAVARQQMDFGDASEYGPLSGEYFTFSAGTDITPLLAGLEDDLCQCPHWGYVLTGTLTVEYGDGSNERTDAGDLFYWPPGHTVRADAAAEIVMFSPQHEHAHVLEHINERVAESPRADSA